MTKHSLSEYRQGRLTGRSSRVWLVEEVTSKTELSPKRDKDGKALEDKVLKDVWLSKHDRSELQIQTAVFESIERFASSEGGEWTEMPIVEGYSDEDKAELAEYFANGKYKELFSRIQQEHRGEPSKAVGKPGCKRGSPIFTQVEKKTVLLPYCTTRRGGPTTKPTVLKSKRKSTDNADKKESTSSTTEAAPEATPEGRVRFEPKTRCFTLFDDVCTPLHELPNLGAVIDVILQTILGKNHLMIPRMPSI